MMRLSMGVIFQYLGAALRAKLATSAICSLAISIAIGTTIAFGFSALSSSAIAQTSSPNTQPSAPLNTPAVTKATWASYEAMVGDHAIKLPIPPGYTEPSSDMPGFRRMGEQLTAKTNRLMALYVSLPDFRKAAVGGEPEMRQYFMVQTLRSMESTRFESAMLEATKTMLKNQANSLFKDAGSESQAALDSYAKSIGNGEGKIKLGEVTSLGVFDERPDSMTILGVTKVQVVRDGVQTELPILFATNFLRLKDRVVYFYAYTRYAGKDDIEWAAESSKAWVTQALLMNQ
jgi:hypothetical protein